MSQAAARKSTPHPTIDHLEDALLAAERQLDVSLTIVDARFDFAIEGRYPVLGARRHSHKKNPVCAVGFCSRCTEHCRSDMTRRGSVADAPFTHQCWKGLEELVVPLRWEGRHVANLFAGIWRPAAGEGSAERPPVAAVLPTEWYALYEALPVMDAARVKDLGQILSLLGRALVAMISEVIPLDEAEPSRRAIMNQFFSNIDTRPGSLAYLAAALHVSPSRAGHLVKEFMGKSFQTCVQERRLAHACDLLVTTTLSHTRIAQRIGMNSTPHFARLFRKVYGVPPGEYRRTHRRSRG